MDMRCGDEVPDPGFFSTGSVNQATQEKKKKRLEDIPFDMFSQLDMMGLLLATVNQFPYQEMMKRLQSAQNKASKMSHGKCWTTNKKKKDV